MTHETKFGEVSVTLSEVAGYVHKRWDESNNKQGLVSCGVKGTDGKGTEDIIISRGHREYSVKKFSDDRWIHVRNITARFKSWNIN